MHLCVRACPCRCAHVCAQTQRPEADVKRLPLSLPTLRFEAGSHTGRRALGLSRLAEQRAAGSPSFGFQAALPTWFFLLSCTEDLKASLKLVKQVLCQASGLPTLHVSSCFVSLRWGVLLLILASLKLTILLPQPPEG